MFLNKIDAAKVNPIAISLGKNSLFSSTDYLYNLINTRNLLLVSGLNYQKKGDGLYSRRKHGAISAYELRRIY